MMVTSILNDDLALAAMPADVRRAFLGGRAEKRLLRAGQGLYKLTQHPLFKPDGSVTPWWSSVEPLAADDPGLEATLERAGALKASPADFARARTAVTRQWNRMDGLLRVRLARPVYGFAGRCASQRFDEDPALANVAFIGGAYQLWIPNLTRGDVTPA